MSNDHDLNDRQRKFCEYFAQSGNATEAAKQAGYSAKTARQQAQRLLTNVDIIQYIRQLQDNAAEIRLSTMTQVKAFWADTMNNPTEKTADRLKASELYAKSAGMFLHPSQDGELRVWGETSDGDDIVLYLPQMLSEKECEWDGPEEE